MRDVRWMTLALALLAMMPGGHGLAIPLSGPTAAQSHGKPDEAAIAAKRKEGDRLFALGKFEEAKAAYLPLAPFFKEDFEFNKRLGYCLSNSPKKEMDKAALYYGRAHALNPKNREVEIEWARTLSWSGQYSAAITAWQRIVAREPANRDALLELARAQNYGHDAAGARTSYESYLSRWPQDTQVRLEYAAFLSWGKHPEEALEPYHAILKSDPNNVAALVGQGRVLAWQGQLEKALESYNLALKRAPNQFDALHGKAFALLWLQRYEEADQVFARANRLKPPDEETKEAMRRIARWKAEAPQRKHQAALDVYRRPAEAALARNDLPQAIQLLRQALTVDPQDEETRFRLGQVYLWNQQWAEAIEVFQNLCADHPESLPALRELGHAQVGAKKLAEAAQTYRKYLERSPDVAVRLDLARVLSWSGQLEAARATYKEVLAEQPENYEAGLGLAQVTSWEGKTQDALVQFDALLRRKPGDRDALMGKALVLSWSGRSKEALPILEELRAALPQDREVANVLESVREAQRQQETPALAAAARTEDLQKQIRGLEEKVTESPNDPAALRRLGDLYSQNRDFPHSLSYYEKALALRPGDADLQLTLARVTSWNRDFPRSIELYRGLLAQKPENRDYRLELARILSWTGHFAESVQAYRELLQRDPTDTEARMGLAQVLSWDKRLDESLVEYDLILQADSHNRQAKLQQARVYSWKGDLKIALRLYDEVLIQAPTDREARLGKAQALNWSGHPREARSIIADIQKKYPEDRDVALANASVQSSLGRRDLALRQLDELDKLQPGNRDVEAMRRAIRQDLRPTLVINIIPAVDSGSAVTAVSAATFYFNPTPQIRSWVVTNFLQVSDPVSDQEVGREFIFGSSARVADWLQLRGEIGLNAATVGDPSPIGGGGATFFAPGRMQFDFDASRRFVNYVVVPIRNDISRVQLHTAWNWRPTLRTNVRVDYFHEDYSDGNVNNAVNVSLLDTVLRREHVEVDAGYLFADSGFSPPIVSSGYYAPTGFQRHAGLGNVRLKLAARTGLSFWGSLGAEKAFDQPYGLDGTARVSWDYKVSQKYKFSLGYGYFHVSAVGGTGAYVTHTGYASFEHVF